MNISEELGLCFKVNSSSLQFDESGDRIEDLTSSKSTYMDLLHHFEDKLKSSRIQDFVATGVVFVNPTEASSTCPPVVEHILNIEQFVNTGQFTINDAHSANSQMIGYEALSGFSSCIKLPRMDQSIPMLTSTIAQRLHKKHFGMSLSLLQN